MTAAPYVVLFTETEIQARLNSLADEIAARLPADLLAVAILKGSFVFAADLVRAFHARGMQPEVDFLTLSSYGKGKESSGLVQLLRDVESDVSGRHLLLIDDILDSGRTLAFACSHMRAKGALSASTCVLLDKRASSYSEKVKADFAGFACPDEFVVGYGMDHAHRYRELPFIATLSQ